MLKKTSDIGEKGHHASSCNSVSARNSPEKETEKNEIKGWRATPIRDLKNLRYGHENITADKNKKKEQNTDVLKKEGWKAIQMIDPKTLRNETESMTSRRPNRKRRIKRKRIKRKRKKGKKKPRRKRKHKSKGCRKKVTVKGKRICVKRRCTVSWCKNRKFRPLQQNSPHKYNYWGQNMTIV